MTTRTQTRHQHIEKLALFSILAAILVIDFFIETQFAFLNFYFLPIMVAGYYLGKRQAVLLAFFTVLLVWAFVIGKNEIITGDSWRDLDLTVWGGFLILAGWLGSLSEKLHQELDHSDALRQELADERDMLRNSIEKLNMYTHQLEKRVEERADQLESANRQLKWSVMTDHLTQLLNRRAMEDRLQHEKVRFDRSGKTFSIVMADIDDFKRINDNYGHDAGDFVLRSLAEVMRPLPRKQDAISRWGGEEFLLVLPETNLEGAWVLAEKIRKEVQSAPLHYGAQPILTSMSLGIAAMEKGKSLSSMLREADERLYAAKKEGKNRTCPSQKEATHIPAF